MFTNGHKSQIGQPCECNSCHQLFSRIYDDEDYCERCIAEANSFDESSSD